MSFVFTDLISYLKKNNSIIIATINNHNTPDLTTIWNYHFDGITLYFDYDREQQKEDHLIDNNNIAIMVQHENQAPSEFTNITLYGKARQLTGDDFKTVKYKLLAKNSKFTYNEENKNIYQVQPSLIKIVDQSKKPEDQVRLIKP